MKPILFNTEMVRAILDNRKTMTRRVVKLKYSNTHLEMFTNKYGTRLIEKQNDVPGVTMVRNPDGTTTHTLLACIEKEPPYRPGDILYVRETWTQDGDVYRYKAGYYDQNRKWRPSIHMPREAARIFLRVTDVKVDRLQEIDDTQAVIEGAEGEFCNCDGSEVFCSRCCNTGWLISPRSKFSCIWDSTLKPADRTLYSWEANPWVWVIEFERCEKPQSQLEKDILRYYSPAVLGLGETERTMKENDAGGACAAGTCGQKADRPVYGRGENREVPQCKDNGGRYPFRQPEGGQEVY